MPKVVAGYKEEAKRTILETAVAVFAEKGFQGATMEDVAKKLGVSKGAVYQYFPSKDELFRELCGNVAQKVVQALETTFVGPSISEAAERYIDLEFEKIGKGQMLMFEALSEASRNPALQRVLKDNYVACVNAIADFLEGLKEDGKVRKDLNTKSAARLLIALRHGAVVSFRQGLGMEEAKKVWLDGFQLVLTRSV